jgi:hypothetical protein
LFSRISSSSVINLFISITLPSRSYYKPLGRESKQQIKKFTNGEDVISWEKSLSLQKNPAWHSQSPPHSAQTSAGTVVLKAVTG